MRVFCPNCSEPINIADDLAGKTTNCPLCKSAFTAPTLFSSAPAMPAPTTASTAGAAATMAAAASTPSNSSPNSPPAPPSALGPSTSISATPPPPSPPPKEIIPVPSLSTTTPGPATGYGRSFGLAILPEIIQWTAPVALGLCVVLTFFFSWNGAYPGGHGVYTQGGW